MCGDFKQSTFMLGLFVIRSLSIIQDEYTWHAILLTKYFFYNINEFE